MRWAVEVMDLPTRRHGNSGFPYPAFRATHVAGRCLREGVAGFPEGLRDVLQVVDLPRDPRGIVLLCGYVAAGAPIGTAAGSTCGAPSIATCAMAGPRSTWSGGAARSSRCAW